jgi:hypothetical protein
MSPFRARERKQMRHIWNFRKKARGRPHRGQRLYARTGNFGFRRALFIRDVFATLASP